MDTKGSILDGLGKQGFGTNARQAAGEEFRLDVPEQLLEGETTVLAELGGGDLLDDCVARRSFLLSPTPLPVSLGGRLAIPKCRQCRLDLIKLAAYLLRLCRQLGKLLREDGFVGRKLVDNVCEFDLDSHEFRFQFQWRLGRHLVSSPDLTTRLAVRSVLRRATGWSLWRGLGASATLQ